MKLDNKTLILTVLIIGAVLGLYLRNAPFTQGNLDVDAPPLRTSYDVFANTEHIKWIANSEQNYYLSPARTGGVTAINAQNPLYYVLIGTFTKLSATNAYQNAYLVLNLLSLFIILCVFVLVERTFGTPVALITAFFGFFLQPHWLFPMYIGFHYDYHTYHLLAGIFFFIMYLFAWSRKTFIEDTLIYSIIGILLAGVTMSHYSETFFFGPLIALGLATHILFYRDYTLAKKTLLFALPFIITTLFFLYFYPITAHVHLTGGISGQAFNQINPERAKHLDYFPWPRFSTGINLLAALGIISIILMGISKKIDTKRTLLLLIIVYIIFIGTSNYTLNVWANRAERQLFLGYSFLVLLPALGIMGIATLLVKDKKILLGIALLASLSIALLNYSPTFDALATIQRGTYFDDNKWEAVHWIRDNTPTDARILFLSGYIHEFQMFAERIELKGDLNLGHTQENIKTICNQTWPETVVGDWGFRDPPRNGFLTKRTSWNSFDYQLPFQDSNVYTFTTMNQSRDTIPLAFFDYIVLQHSNTGGFDPCMRWFINQSIARNYTIAYANHEMAVIQQ